jgi:hypothetical protein
MGVREYLGTRARYFICLRRITSRNGVRGRCTEPAGHDSNANVNGGYRHAEAKKYLSSRWGSHDKFASTGPSTLQLELLPRHGPAADGFARLGHISDDGIISATRLCAAAFRKTLA